MSFEPSEIPYATQVFQTFKDPQEREHNARAVEEISLLQFEQSEVGIEAGQYKEFSLELGYHFQLLSVWVDAEQSADDRILFELYLGGNLVTKLSLSSGKVPFAFPPLFIDGTLPFSFKIKPNRRIENVFLFARNSVKIERKTLTRLS